ncbi:hypothetical protein AGABI1DRAFT_134210 [Agaricus bisporus var. burnettii JB137-S8]|uniref:Uncharacterized protein n=1 Tax=Agaricus bisporus var. burnettii (strain JB137-S8 / ATCC MYA-4627 / FGSC 10392) TaxID=597362 RepID=K5XH35_AGABU|nr:uncharacterized protein AGABI1DRAFT_134210 [Agaricus bisporus var. burnettii JB137-S8]EKM73715.1 hypothetical protein AGABI1DRAFT_134210 [Agaricus bisporus var. burnettii JB137-S8]
MTRSPYFSSPVLNYSTSPYPADEVEAIRTEKEKERRESSNLNTSTLNTACDTGLVPLSIARKISPPRLRGALQRTAIGRSTLTSYLADRRKIVSSRAGRVFSTPTATAQASRCPDQPFPLLGSRFHMPIWAEVP